MQAFFLNYRAIFREPHKGTRSTRWTAQEWLPYWMREQSSVFPFIGIVYCHMTHDTTINDRQNAAAMGNGRQKIRAFTSADEVAKAGAERFVQIMQETLKKNERCSVVLGGGTTFLKMYALLAARKDIDWTKVHLFIGDERFVPHTDPQSNWGAIGKVLMDQIDIPPRNLHPVRTEGVGLEEAAREYEGEIRTFFVRDLTSLPSLMRSPGRNPPSSFVPLTSPPPFPKEEKLGSLEDLSPFEKGSTPNEVRGEGFLFDLVLLGIGPDGHTLSIFPGSEEAKHPSYRLAIAVHDSPNPPAERISLSYRAVNQARNILFLVTGAEKKEAFEAILHGPEDRVRWPAQGVNGKVEWFTEELPSS